jgi:hypothetical protein
LTFVIYESLANIEHQIYLIVLLDACYMLFLGALAQMVERLLCKQDVVGSIPSGSTITSQVYLTVLSNLALLIWFIRLR